MKTFKFLLSSIFFISCTLLYSCKKDNLKDSSGSTTLTITGNKLAPDGFNFSTTKDVSFNVKLLTNNNKGIPGIFVNIYLPNNTSLTHAIFTGITDKDGQLAGKVTIPAYTTQLIIDPKTVGVLRMAMATINNNAITATLGGKSGYSGDVTGVAADLQLTGSKTSSKLIENDVSIPFVYPGGCNASSAFTTPANLGRPVWIDPKPDEIDPSLITYVNNSLPDYQSIVKTHPQFLDNATNVVNVVNKSDVWITFVSAYAANHNTLAYYTYPTNNPPGSVSDISKFTYIFPNASFLGWGGNLSSGDRVKLGTFDAGTTVAFVLIQNAWNGTEPITSNEKFFSQNQLNPETDPTLKQHSIILYDDQHKLYLTSFEDKNRQTEYSDNDFNDLVFYTTATNITDIDNTGVPPIDKGCPDSDGDGVDDCHDQFPNDPDKAYTSYYPCQTCYANIAFEDNWPNKGDYDLNDLVVNYQYQFISNAKNQVVSFTGRFSMAAAGASFKNGFGIQLPVSASAVSSVTGEKLSSGTYIQLAGNGVEAGQSNAVIIPFDNQDLMAHNPDYSFFINTLMSKDKVKSDTAIVTVNFDSPVDSKLLTASAFNPFLISNQRRGYEVHLPGYKPTDKADSKLFGTGDDNSNPSNRRYYLTADNWPWALNYTQVFNYPVETVNITEAYLHFKDWASSGGSLYPDWYSNTATDYRATAFIYNK